MNDYYVYVYIDPRNYEEFYYGKGSSSRKDAHLADTSNSAKSKRISEIGKEGLEPIIRVIARGLTEAQALQATEFHTQKNLFFQRNEPTPELISILKSLKIPISKTILDIKSAPSQT
jgi:hypothetical protein